jgi:small subunit ribosomal protein S2
LGLTTVSLIDTDCDPDQVDLPIPGNDDGIRSIELIIRHLADAVLAGRAALPGRREVSDASAAVADKDSNESAANAESRP